MYFQDKYISYSMVLSPINFKKIFKMYPQLQRWLFSIGFSLVSYQLYAEPQNHFQRSVCLSYLTSNNLSCKQFSFVCSVKHNKLTLIHTTSKNSSITTCFEGMVSIVLRKIQTEKQEYNAKEEKKLQTKILAIFLQ